jgi:HD superfamily phosphodiesterase
MEGVTLFYQRYYPIISRRFEQELDPAYEYHNLRHTLDVIACSQSIGRAEGCDDYELVLLSVAALFHDSGFLYQRKNHEDISVKLFTEAARDTLLSKEEIAIICGCIKATRMPQNPNNKLETILCDADLDYLGRDDFEIIGDALHREMAYCGEIESEDAWRQLQIDFLSAHSYFTLFSREHRYPILQKNLSVLRLG